MSRASWNPFRVGGTALPPSLLLMAKIIAVVFVLSGQVAALHQPFLAFIPGLDQAAASIPIAPALQVAVVVAAIALVFNRYVRTACLIIGAVILFSILSSRMYYQNNRLYAGLVLLLLGLYHRDIGARLVQLQVILMYFGAALNKLLEVDWRNGHFFATWAAVSPYHTLYSSAAHLLPGAWLYILMGWSVILVEFVIAAAFAIPRFRPFAIWLAVGYHTSLLVVAGRTFGLFWFSLLASYLAFVELPPITGTVHVPVAGLWRRIGALLQRLDLEDALTWAPAAIESLQLRARAVTRKGLLALLYVILLNPITYLISAALLAPLPEHRVRYAGVLVLGVLAVIAIDFVVTRRSRLQEIWRPASSATPTARLGSTPLRP